MSSVAKDVASVTQNPVPDSVVIDTSSTEDHHGIPTSVFFVRDIKKIHLDQNTDAFPLE